MNKIKQIIFLSLIKLSFFNISAGNNFGQFRQQSPKGGPQIQGKAGREAGLTL